MKVGLAMFTVRNSFAQDPKKTIKAIAEAGYKYIEIANHHAEEDPGTGFGFSSADLKRIADENGIRIVGAHIMPAGGTRAIEDFYYDEKQLRKIAEYYNDLGGQYLSLPIDFFPSEEYLLKRCELYNRMGKMFREYGIQFLYHNHYHEFQVFGDNNMMDLIVKNTDPAYVGIELDAYWTICGAFDPAKKIRQYGSRIMLLHQKDFPLEQVEHLNMWTKVDRNKPLDWDSFHAAIKPEYFTEVGDGMIKIQDVIDAGNESKVPLIFVEQDYSSLPELESIKVSMANFKKMRGLEWD